MKLPNTTTRLSKTATTMLKRKDESMNNKTTSKLIRSTILGKAKFAVVAAATALSLAVVDADAQNVNIQNPNAIAGQVSWSSSANNWVFTAGNKSIIEFGAFNIYHGGSVQFIQPGANSAVLNRIVGADPSTINGGLSSNGRLFFVNPAGITFGANAVLNVGQIYAAAGSISNSDFLGGNYRFTNLDGTVKNLGTINASGGVALLGQHVINHGQIYAPGGFITLVAADKVILAPDGSGIIVQIDRTTSSGTSQAGIENTGLLNANGGHVTAATGDLYSLAMDISGTIVAKDIHLQGGDDGIVKVSGNLNANGSSNGSNMGGKIVVEGEKVWLANGARLNATGANGGGEILVGGDFQGKNNSIRNAWRTHVSQNVVLNASATHAGHGGKIIIWSDNFTNYFGTIKAKGAGYKGRGGFAEVSGKKYLGFAGMVNLKGSQGGRTGTLLLDPTDITITENTTSASIIESGGNPNTFTEGPADNAASSIGVDGAGGINAALVNANVIISTVSGGAGNGDIIWNANGFAIDDGGAGNFLRLSAERDITFADAPNFGAWTGHFDVQAGVNINTNAFALIRGSAGDISLLADFDANGTGTLTIGGAITTAGGNLILQGTDLILGAFAQDAGAGTIFLQASETNANYTVGGGGANFGVSDAELDQMTAALIEIGRSNATAGTILIDAGITMANASDLLIQGFNIDVDFGIAMQNGQSLLLEALNNGAGSVTFAGVFIDSDSTEITVTGDNATIVYDAATVFRNNAGAANPATFLVRTDNGAASLNLTAFMPEDSNFQTAGNLAGTTITFENLGSANLVNDIGDYLGGSFALVSGGGSIDAALAASEYGDLTLTTFDGDVTQTGTLTLTTLDVDAGAGNITLGEANEFNGGVTLTGATVVINDNNDLELAAVTAGTLIVTTDNDGNITNSGALTVSGVATFNAGAGNITLANAGNEFSGAVALTGTTVEINDAGADVLNLGAVDATTLTVTTDNDGNITGSGVITVANTASFDAGGGNIVLDSANLFSGAVSLVGTTVTINDDDALILGTSNITGQFTLAAGGNVTQTGGSTIIIGGVSDINAAGSDVTLNLANNDFQASVEVDGVNVDLQDTNEFDMGTSNITGTFDLAAGGNVTQTVASTIIIGGVSDINAAGSDVTLNLANNDFQASVEVDGVNVDLQDTNEFDMGTSNITGTFDLAAGGNVTQTGGSTIIIGGVSDINAAGSDVTLNLANNDFQASVEVDGVNVDLQDTNEFDMGTSNITGTFDLAAGGNVTQTVASTIIIGGVSDINAAGSDVTLNLANNDFQASVEVDGVNVDLADDNEFEMGTSNITGTFDLAAGGAVTQTGASTIIIGGVSDINAAGSDVTLNLANNDFQASVEVDGVNVDLQDTNEFDMGTSNITGTFDLAAGGNVTQTGGSTIIIGGVSDINAAGSDVTLNLANNDFQASVEVDGVNVDLQDTNEFDMGTSNITGTFDLAAGGNVTQTVASTIIIGGVSDINAAGSDVTLNLANNDFQASVEVDGVNVDLQDTNEFDMGTSNITGTFDLAAGGNVTQTGGSTIIIGGVSDINAAGSDVTLNLANNDFQASVEVDGVNVDLQDTNEFDMGTSNITGTFDLAAGGNVTQTGGSTIIIGGVSDINAAGSDVTLNLANNDFQASVEVDGVNVDLQDTNEFDMGTSNITGTFDLAAGGNVTQTGGSTIIIGGVSDINAAGSDVTLNLANNDFQASVEVDGVNVDLQDTNEFDMGTSNITGTFDLAAGGNVTQTVASTIIIGGVSDINAAGSDVTLNLANNDFQASVEVDGVNVDLQDTNEFDMGTSNITGTFDLAAGGNVTQTGASTIIIGGVSDINAAGSDVTLNLANNDFQASVEVDGVNVDLQDTNEFDMGTSNITGTFDLAAGGNVTQTVASTIIIGGVSDINAAGSDVTLNLANNDFQASVEVDGVNVDLADDNEFEMGTSNITGTFDLAAGGAVTQTGASTIIIGGVSDINAAGFNVTLNEGTNDFQAAVEVDGANVDLQDVNGFNLGASTISGTFDLIAGGAVIDSGIVTIAGDAELTARGQDITLGTTDFDGEIIVNTSGIAANGGNVSITNDPDGLLFTSVNTSGSTGGFNGGNITLQTATELEINGTVTSVGGTNGAGVGGIGGDIAITGDTVVTVADGSIINSSGGAATGGAGNGGVGGAIIIESPDQTITIANNVEIRAEGGASASATGGAAANNGGGFPYTIQIGTVDSTTAIDVGLNVIMSAAGGAGINEAANGATGTIFYGGTIDLDGESDYIGDTTFGGDVTLLNDSEIRVDGTLTFEDFVIGDGNDLLLSVSAIDIDDALFFNIPLFTLTGFAGTENISLGDDFDPTFTINIDVSLDEIDNLENGGNGIGELQVGVKDFVIMNDTWALWEGDAALEAGLPVPFDLSVEQVDASGANIYWGTWDDGELDGFGDVDVDGDVRIDGSGGSLVIAGINTATSWSINDSIQVNYDAMIRTDGGVNDGDITIFGDHSISSFNADNDLIIEASNGNTITITDATFDDTADSSIENLTVQSRDSGGVVIILDALNGTITGGLVVESDALGSITLNTTGGNFTANLGMEFRDALTLDGTTDLRSDGSDITFNDTINGDFALTFDTGNTGAGQVFFKGTVGGNTELDSLTVDGDATVAGVDINVENAIIFNDAVNLTVGDVLIQSSASTIAFQTIDGGQNLTLGSATGTGITFNDDIGTTSLASLTVNAGPSTTIETGVTIDTVGNITFADAVLIVGAAELSTGIGGGITFVSTLDGDAANTGDLVLTAGTGGVTFTNTVGATALNSMVVNGDVSIGVGVVSIDVQDALTFNDAITGTGTFTLTSTAGTVTVANITNTDAINIVGNVGITLTGTDYISTTDSIALTGNVSLENNVTLTAEQGNITINDNVEADNAGTQNRTLSLDAGLAGTILVSGTIGANDALAGLTVINSASTTFTGAVTVNDELGAVVIADTETGTVTFTNLLTATSLTAATGLFQAYNVQLDGGANISGFTEFSNTGTVTLGSGGDIFAFDGGLTATLPSTVFLDGTVSTLNSQVSIGALDLNGAGIIDTFTGGAIEIDTIVGDAFALTLISGDQTTTVTGNATGLGVVTVQNAASTGGVTFSGDLTATDFITAAGAHDVSLLGTTTTIENATTFNNIGTLTLGGLGDTVTFAAGVDATAPSLVNVGGNIDTDTGAMIFGNITLTDATSFDSGTSAMTIANITSTGKAITLESGTTMGIGAIADISGGVTLTDAGGQATFNGALGSGVTGDILVSDSNGVDFDGAVNAGTITLTNTTGIVAFNSTLDANDLVTDNAAYDLSLLGNTTIAQQVDMVNTGTVTLGDNAGDTLEFNGGLSFSGGTNSSLGGTIQSSDDDINFGIGTATLTATTIVDTNGGNLVFGGDITGVANDLTLISQSGTIGVTGAATDLGVVTLQEFEATSTGAVTFNGNLTADSLVTFARNYDVSLLGTATTITDDTSFLNTGTLTLGDGGDTLTFVGGVDAVAGNVISVGGTVNTTDQAMNFGNISLNADSTFDTTGAAAAGTMVIGNIATNQNQLTLDTGTFAGGTMDIGAIDDATGGVIITDAGGLATIASVGGGAGTLQVVNSQAGVTFTGAVDVGIVDLDATTGTIEFSDNLTATTLTTTGDGFNLSLLGTTTTITDDTSFLNTGTLTLGNGGDTLTFVGGVDATAGNVISVGGTVNTTDTAMDFGNLGLNNDSTFDTTGAAAAGTMVIGNIATNQNQLTLDTGTFAGGTMGIGAIDDATGGVIITDAGGLATIASVGGGAGTLQVVNSQAGVTFTGAVDVGIVDLDATTGTIEFSDNLTATTLTTTGDGFNLSLLGTTTTITDDTSFLNTGTLTLGNGGDTLTFVGGVDATAGNVISVGGTVNTTDTAMDFGNLGLNNDSSFDTTGAAAAGTMVIGNIATNQNQLTLDTGTFAGGTMDIGAIDDATGGVIITDAGGLATIASVGGAAGTLQVVNSQAGVTFTGAVDVGIVDLDATTGTIEFSDNLTATTLTTTGDGFNLSLLGTTTTITDDTSFLNTGTLTLGNGGDTLTFVGGVDATAGNVISVGGTVNTTDTAMDFGNLGLNNDSTFDTTGAAAAGTMVIGNIATNQNQLTLDTGTFAGGTMGIGAIDDATGGVIITDAGGLATIASVGGGAGTLQVVNSQAGVTFTGAVDVGIVDLDATTGTIEFSDNLTATTLTTTGDGFNLSLLGTTTTITDDTSFLNTGTLTLGNGGDTLTFVGGVDATAGNVISVGGTVNTTDTAMDFGNLGLNNDSSFDTTGAAAAGTMVIGNIATNQNQLTLDTGTFAGGTMGIGAIDDATGGVIITDAGGLATIASVGGAAGTLQVVNSQAGVTFTGAVDVGIVDLDATTGTIEFSDNLTATTLTTTGDGFNLSLLGAATTITDDTSFLNIGTLTLGNGGDTLTFIGGVDATAGNVISVGGTVNTTDTAMDFGNLGLNNDSTFDTTGAAAAGTMVIGNIATNQNQLTLDTGTFAGGTMGIGAIDDATGGVIIRDAGGLATIASVGGAAGTLQVVNSQAGVTFTGAVDVGIVDLDATTGTIEFSDNLTATTLTTTGDGFNLSLLGTATTITDVVDFANTGFVTLGDGGDTLTFTNGLTRSGNGFVNIGGTVQSTNSDIHFGTGPATLTSGSAVDSSGGTITFGGLLDGFAGGETLTLTAGAGDIDFDGVVGTTRLGDVLVNSVATMTADAGFDAASFEQTAGSVATIFTGALDVTNDVTITNGTDVMFSTVDATEISQVAGSGTTTFGGAVTTSGANGVNVTNDAIALNASIGATGGTVDLVADTAAVTIAAAGDITAGGDVNLTGATGINTGGDVTTSGATGTVTIVALTGDVTLTADVDVDTSAVTTGGGGITVTGDVNGAFAMNLDAEGDILIMGNVGSTNPLASLTGNSTGDTEVTGTIDSAGDIDLLALGDVTLGGDLTAGGDVLITTGAVGTIAFESNVSTVTAEGDIVLSNTAVSATNVPAIATITAENSNGITFDAGNDFIMTAGEKLTAFDIDIQTGQVSGTGRAVLGDLVSLGDIRVTADDIDFISRDSAQVLTSDGTLVWDQGVDVVAAGDFIFSVAPTVIGGSGFVQFSSNNIDPDVNGTLSDWIVRWSPNAVTVNSIILGDTVLDLRADGMDHLTVEELGALSGAITPMSQMVPIVQIQYESDDDEFETEEEAAQDASQDASQEAAVQGF